MAGWDAIQTAINKKEGPPLGGGGQKKFGERNREIERESDHCNTEKYIPKEHLLLGPCEEGLK